MVVAIQELLHWALAITSVLLGVATTTTALVSCMLLHVIVWPVSALLSSMCPGQVTLVGCTLLQLLLL
jgi:hypothetical protein